MKRITVLLVITAYALAACQRTDLISPGPDTVQFVIDFTVSTNSNAPETKVVKNTWESGDDVYLFFYNLTGTSDKYLKLKYDGSKWTVTPYGSLTAEDLTGLSTKMLKAVYLPFGHDNINWGSTGSEGPWNYYLYTGWGWPGQSYLFWAYYLVSESIGFTVDVAEGVVTIAVDGNNLPMSPPANYVQFFIEDADAYDCGASLRVNHLAPGAFRSLKKNLDVTTSVMTDGNLKVMYGAAIPGYYYEKGGKKGYVFSGILNSDVQGQMSDYNFTLVKGNQAYTATATGRTLNGRSAADITGLNWTETPVTFVDLGLPSGTKWADRNLGAFAQSDIGNYFSWGDKKSYVYAGANRRYYSTHVFGDNNYIFAGSGWAFTKYVPTDLAEFWDGTGNPDNLTQLESADDAAYHTNAAWRIPTKEQWEELINPYNCQITWENVNNGFRITSIKEGYTDRSILLPLTSILYEDNYTSSRFQWWELAYWSTDLGPTHNIKGPSQAYYLRSDRVIGSVDYSSSVSVSIYFRQDGMLIRPVTK